MSSTSTNRTTEELADLEHFKTTHSRQEDGRYIVRLPRKENTLALACSREQAVKQFLQNEKALARMGKLSEFLTAIFYNTERGHSERVPAADLHKPETETYYLPM